jgi:glycosyltransferase involved in cell wall biosynthesis
MDRWQPLVTIIMPIRNEAAFIGRLLRAVFDQDYPAERMDVIVADGMSTDGTREIVRSLQQEHANLRLIDNPQRIVSTALNTGLAHARGDVILRIDGHCDLARDFVGQNIALLEEHPEAWCVGGPIVHTAKTRFGRAVAAAMSHPLGVGNATHRFAHYEGYGEGAVFPAIRRWVFDKVGEFDEQLVRNQDDEFNYRVNQAGGKIYISPRVHSLYFVRERVGQLYRQYYQYAFWRIPVMRKHRRPTTARQLAPVLFYGMVIALALLGLALRQPLVALALPIAYLAALLAGGLSLAPKESLPVACLIPIAFATMHAGYAAGMLYGLWAAAFQPGAWSYQSPMASLSR